MVLGDLGDSSTSAPCFPLHNNNNSNHHNNNNVPNGSLILGMDKKPPPLSNEEMAMLQKIEEANR
jgi:hypothetical protein